MKHCVAVFLLLVASPAYAADTHQERLPFVSDPAREWIVAVVGSDIRLEPASLRKTPKELVLEVDRAVVKDSGLVTPVVELSDGTIQSGRLHAVSGDDPTLQSDVAAELHRTELESRARALEESLAALNKRLSEVSDHTRKEAGFDEVDEVLAKVSKLNQEIAVLNSAAK